MKNTVIEGSENIDISEGFSRQSINQDWPLVGKIVSYLAPIITFNFAWDKSSPQKNFFAQAKFINDPGIPLLNQDLQVGQDFELFRIGNTNNNNTASGFALYDETAIDKISFLALFAKSDVVEEVIIKDSRYQFIGYVASIQSNPTTGLQTVGIPSFFEVFVNVGASGTGNASKVGHVVEAQSWKLVAYDNYDIPTQTYSNKFAETGLTKYSGGPKPVDGAFFNTISVAAAGTGQDNDNIWPAFDLYISPSPLKFMRVEEIGPDPQVSDLATSGGIDFLRDTTNSNFEADAIEVDDVLTLTNPSHVAPITTVIHNRLDFAPDAPSVVVAGVTGYSVPQKNRGMVNDPTDPSFQARVYPIWSLSVAKARSKYDPLTGLFGSGTFLAVDAGLFSGAPDTAAAHRGFKHDATAYIIYHDTGTALSGPVAGWPGVTARFYTENITFESGRDFFGGRIITSMAATNWFQWNQLTLMFDVMTPQTPPTLGFNAGDEWKSRRVATIPTPGLLHTWF